MIALTLYFLTLLDEVSSLYLTFEIFLLNRIGINIYAATHKLIIVIAETTSCCFIKRISFGAALFKKMKIRSNHSATIKHKYEDAIYSAL